MPTLDSVNLLILEIVENTNVETVIREVTTKILTDVHSASLRRARCKHRLQPYIPIPLHRKLLFISL